MDWKEELKRVKIFFFLLKISEVNNTATSYMGKMLKFYNMAHHFVFMTIKVKKSQHPET